MSCNVLQRIRSVSLCFLLLIPAIANGQGNSRLKGLVQDDKGHAISGAIVIAKNEKLHFSQGAETDTAGTFYFGNLPNNGSISITVSFTGYIPQSFDNYSLSKDGLTTMYIKLAKDTFNLGEVVVVGYGTQRKKDITGSIAVVSSHALENRPNVQFGDALEGKAAGVQVLKSSGAPESGFSIRIRGTSSITSGSEPLYLVDGVPTQSIAEINPADIESFSILKDASASAIYGASGANGVVLITTKRGRNGKTIVSFDSYYGVTNVRKKIPVLNSTQYAGLIHDMGESIDTSVYNANTNWQDQLFRTGTSQNVNLSVRGGTAKTAFYLSGGLVRQNGIVITNTMNRASFKTNLDHTINHIFKVGTSVSYNRWYDVSVSEGANGGANSVLLNTLTGSPAINIYNSTGTKFTVDPFYQDLDNPVGLARGNNHYYIKNRFLGNGYVEANITPDLKARAMLGYENYTGKYQSFVDPYKTTEGRSKKGIGNYSSDASEYWMSENTLTYRKILGKHSIGAMAGFIASKTVADGASISTRNFANGNITTVNGGSIIDAATQSVTKISTTSVISRLTYSYDERYYFTGNFRADGSSVFGPASRWGYFPAFSVAWRISNEAFFRELTPVVNDLKFRFSWGDVGNSQIAAYAYLGTIAASGSYVFGNQVNAGYTPTTLGNDNLHWETTRQTDIGFDMSLFNSRLVLTADYYNKKTIDLLLEAPIPGSSGYTTVLKNVGSLQNRGFEFTAGSKNIESEGFTWSTDFNISLNRNKVLNVNDGIIYDGAINSKGNSIIVKAGLPLGSFYGYVAQGVDPATGNMMYKMANTAAGLQTSDMAVIGNANPDYSFGITNDFRYKNWNFSFFIQSVQGNQILNATRIYSEGMWELRNQTAAVLKRWRKAGDVTDVPKPDYNNADAPYGNYNSQISSRFVENGSYIRLKSLTLGYNLKMKSTNLKLYCTAENLWTITKYSGYDPEVSAFGHNSNTAIGVDFGSYPQTRGFILGLNASF